MREGGREGRRDGEGGNDMYLLLLRRTLHSYMNSED